MTINPSHPLLQYSGRIDFDTVDAPVFVYAGSYVHLRFKGTGVSVKVSNQRSYFTNYLGFVLDGTQDKIQLSDTGEVITYSIGERLNEDVHDLIVFKRMDACHTFTLFGFEIEGIGELLPLPSLPDRRIEVFGDSISCGEVVEALHCVGQSDPKHDGEYSNSWFSYSWMTARKLNAEIHITSQGGIALMDKTGWFCWPDFVGMESVYDKIQYNPSLGPVKQWDFSKWIPQVVVIAFGQNDANPVEYMKECYNGESANLWRKRYRLFIEKILSLYPGCHIILTTTILNHYVNWDKAIEQVCSEMNNDHVHHFLYSRNGAATPGHVRIPEAEEMANELTAYIESLGNIW